MFYIYSAHFVEQYSELSFIEEYVILGFIADMRCKALTNDAVPVCSIFLIELFLYMFGHKVFDFDIIDSVFGLSNKDFTSFIASAIISELSGISTMFSFLITSVMRSYAFVI